MADAISGATLIKLRGTQWQNLFLAVYVPPTIWTSRVDGNPDQGAYDITFDGGALVGVPEPDHHYEVWFGSTSGAKDRGVTRIRNGALPNWAVAAGTLRIAANDMDLADDDYITIKENIRPTAILPSIDGAYEDEDKVYVDENTEQHPLGRIGPPACGFISTANPNLTVNFWSDDVAMAPGAALSSYAWAFTGGNPNSSAIAGTAGAPIAIEYNSAGSHWVRHLVTDDNGKTHKRYTQVHVFHKDDNPPVVDFSIEGLTGDRSTGSWRCTIKVHESCTEGEFPDLAQVVIFTEQYWNGAQSDVGYGWTHRENILFVGYIVGDTVFKDPYDSSVTFEAIGVCELMKNITCWGASFKDASETWHHIPNMTLNLSAFHVFTEHTTLDHIADVYLNLDAITMMYTDLGEGAVFDQIKVQIGEAGRALLMSNAKGQIYLEPDAQLSLVADRPATELWTMNAEDWRERFDLGEEVDGVHACCQVDFISFYYDGSDPKVRGSLAPNRQWPTGSVQKVTGVRADSQADTNSYAGVYEQNYNNPFDNVVAPMHGYYSVLDIAPQTYLRVTLQAADTIRGIIWTAARTVIKSVTHTWNPAGGYILTDAALSLEIGTATGTTNEIPTDRPSDDPPPIDPIPDPPVAEIPYMAFINSGVDGVWKTTDFNEVSPTWVRCLDAADVGGGIGKIDIDQVNGFIYAHTANGVYKADITDAAATMTWTLVLDISSPPSGADNLAESGLVVAANGTVCVDARSDDTCANCGATENRPVQIHIATGGGLSVLQTQHGCPGGGANCCPIHAASSAWFDIMYDDKYSIAIASNTFTSVGDCRGPMVGGSNHFCRAAAGAGGTTMSTEENQAGTWSCFVNIIDLGGTIIGEHENGQIYTLTPGTDFGNWVNVTPVGFSVFKSIERDRTLNIGYLCDEDYVWKTTGGAFVEFLDRTDLVPTPAAFTYARGYNDDDTIAFVGSDNGDVYYTENTGSTWSNKKGDFPNAFDVIQLAPCWNWTPDT